MSNVSVLLSPDGDEDDVMGHVVEGPELQAGAVPPGVAPAVYPDQDRQQTGLPTNLGDVDIEQEAVLVTLLVQDHEARVEAELDVDLWTDQLLRPPAVPDAVPALARQGNWRMKPELSDRRFRIWNILRQS